MVGFVHNHPDRPFVMGGMFHGQVGLGGGINNHMRSIQTKSGIKVLMNDNEKSVTILDPSGNTYFMDGNGNITVTAPNDITFTAGKNMNINVGQNMTTTVSTNVYQKGTSNKAPLTGEPPAAFKKFLLQRSSKKFGESAQVDKISNYDYGKTCIGVSKSKIIIAIQCM